MPQLVIKDPLPSQVFFFFALFLIDKKNIKKII